ILAIMGMEIPAIHYMIAVAGGDNIRCAPYATYGTSELSGHAVRALEARSACLLDHHGMIAIGPSLEKALWLAVEVETLARQYHGCLQIGQPPLWPKDEIERGRVKMAGYGHAGAEKGTGQAVLSRIGKIVERRRGSNRLLTALRALLRSNEFYLIPLALVIGVIAGAVVTLMSEIAQIAHVLIYGIRIDVRLSANDYINPVIALIAPALGGLLLGVMEWSRRRLKISNAVDPIEANALRGGRLSARDSMVVSGQTLISNGCGASVGLEAGYTQIGSGAASLIGQFLNLRRNDLRLIVGCGSAAAIPGALCAPLTRALSACELIVGVYSVASAAPILAASLAGALTAQNLGGAPYSLEVSHVGTVGLEQYLALVGLALIVSVIGILVMRSSSLFERVFKQRWLPIWVRPVIGGICVGGLAIVTPQVLAAGHGAMVLDLHREMAIGFIATVIALKLVACLVSLASGFRGGLFFASLFVGSL